MTEDINCSRLADEFGVSANYVAQLFARGMFCGFSEYVRTQRLELSCELLRNSKMNIGESQPGTLFTTMPCILLLPIVQSKDRAQQERGKFDPEKAYKGVDEGDGYKDGAYGSQPEAHAAFAAMITHLDDQVGDIVSHIKTLGLDNNTIIIFTSDNGPHMEGGADPDYFNSNGPLKGYKRDLYEGGVRVPTIAWGPGFVKTGKTDHVSAFWDFMPTFAEMVGGEIPKDIDGISLLPTLKGEEGQKQHKYLYWEFHEKGGRLAIRKDNWKYIHYNVFDTTNMTTELYDLSQDIGETNNLADENPELVKELEQLMQSARVPSEIFNFQSTTYMR